MGTSLRRRSEWERDAMRPDVLALPDHPTGGRVAALRVELAHHPVHDWTVSRADRATLLLHVAFAHWAGATLATSLRLSGPQRQFDAAGRALRRRGYGAVSASFSADVAAGMDPAAALADAGGPSGAGPLVTLTGHLVARGSRSARAGALLLGLPDCVVDASPADLAAGEGPVSPVAGARAAEASAAAEDAATAMLVAQLTLLDGALAHHPPEPHARPSGHAQPGPSGRGLPAAPARLLTIRQERLQR